MTYSITSLSNFLGLFDNNLTLTAFGEEKIDSVICKVIHAKLAPPLPEHCPHCGDPSLQRHGFLKQPQCILYPDVNFSKTFLALEKQRFLCKACGATWTAQAPAIVDENCLISRNVKVKIALDLQSKRAMSEIARERHVSTNTVSRVLDSFYYYARLPAVLPFVLSVDEFHGTSDMNFIYMDYETGKVIQVLDDRKEKTIRDHFMAHYTRKARAAVRFITMDMYKPYLTLFNVLFPNAQIVIDRFHIVQHSQRELNKLRVRTMNTFKKQHENSNYTRFKNYWRLLLKKGWQVNRTRPFWSPTFKDRLTAGEILDRLLSLDATFTKHYVLHQRLLRAVEWRRVDEFEALITGKHDDLDAGFERIYKTFRTFWPGIRAALEFPYSNGRMEAINNQIKVLKRNAFGFRNMVTFRKRLFVAQSLAVLYTSKIKRSQALAA